MAQLAFDQNNCLVGSELPLKINGFLTDCSLEYEHVRPWMLGFCLKFLKMMINEVDFEAVCLEKE
jgi:hypothetical protein